MAHHLIQPDRFPAKTKSLNSSTTTNQGRQTSPAPQVTFLESDSLPEPSRRNEKALFRTDRASKNTAGSKTLDGSNEAQAAPKIAVQVSTERDLHAAGE
jgi:hypothetical protein